MQRLKVPQDFNICLTIREVKKEIKADKIHGTQMHVITICCSKKAVILKKDLGFKTGK